MTSKLTIQVFRRHPRTFSDEHDEVGEVDSNSLEFIALVSDDSGAFHRREILVTRRDIDDVDDMFYVKEVVGALLDSLEGA